MNLLTCPRCEWAAFEQYETHNYCFNCNFSVPDEGTIPLAMFTRVSLRELGL